MKIAAVKKRFASVGVVVVAAFFALAPAVYADTFPYLKAFGGDSWAGGAYVSNGGCSTSGAYQDPANGGNKDSGGILTYANSSGGGSSDEFGALSLGVIDNSATNYGFYSDGHDASSSPKLSFANTNGGLGGQFEGTTQQAHCIPNYYDSKIQGTPVAFGGNYSASGQFQVVPAATLSGGTVSAGTDLTLFVNGNVYIGGNVTYGSYTEASVPKFALVVKGNIYIAPSVTQLDGVYIAQPTSGTTAGVIWTCYDTTPSASNSTYGPWIHDNCQQKLTVNGALIAQQVNFLRVPANSNVSAVSPSASESATSNNAAEVINYTPSMVIGGPFFNPPASSSLKIESLVSLPPLY